MAPVEDTVEPAPAPVAIPAPDPRGASTDTTESAADDDDEPARDERPATTPPANVQGGTEVPPPEASSTTPPPPPVVDPKGAPTNTAADANATKTAEDVRAASPADAAAVAVQTEAEATSTEPSPPRRGTSTAKPEGITFSGIPAINYIADNGLGLGVIAAMYMHDGVTAPYRTAVTLQIFATTNLVQDHNVIIDSLRVFDLPLRLTSRIGFLSSLTQNYCGTGGTVTCDRDEAEDAARAAGLDEDDDPKAFDDFARHYYQRRFMNPYGLLNARYALIERSEGQPTRVELTGGYRAFYFIPGNVFADDDGDGSPDLTPYPGSLFEKDFPDGEPGLSSVLSLGVMVDSRDNEPAPTEGWWIEGSVRGATPFLSDWLFAGFNVTVRGYTHLPMTVPLLGDLGRRVVLANRLTFDGLVGDIPIQELARLGGSQDVYAFGGADMGRGIRVQRYMGKGKVLDQAELRYRFFEFEVFEQQFALTAAGFLDTAIVTDELIDPKNTGFVGAGGGALRIAWNENFIVRADLGVSPFENWAPQFYLTINQPF